MRTDIKMVYQAGTSSEQKTNDHTRTGVRNKSPDENWYKENAARRELVLKLIVRRELTFKWLTRRELVFVICFCML